jgi:hypothetical protein
MRANRRTLPLNWGVRDEEEWFLCVQVLCLDSENRSGRRDKRNLVVMMCGLDKREQHDGYRLPPLICALDNVVPCSEPVREAKWRSSETRKSKGSWPDDPDSPQPVSISPRDRTDQLPIDRF